MQKVEAWLKELFDYQRFEQDKELNALIAETVEEQETSTLLDDAALSFATGGKKEEEEVKKYPFHEE